MEHPRFIVTANPAIIYSFIRPKIKLVFPVLRVRPIPSWVAIHPVLYVLEVNINPKRGNRYVFNATSIRSPIKQGRLYVKIVQSIRFNRIKDLSSVYPVRMDTMERIVNIAFHRAIYPRTEVVLRWSRVPSMPPKIHNP